MSEGTVGDMAELGITESFQVKRQVLLSASEAAEMILRVDDIIKAAPRSVRRRFFCDFVFKCLLHIKSAFVDCLCRKRVPDHHPC